MRYREAVPADAASIAQLHAESWLATFHGVLSDEYRSGAIFQDRKAVWQERMSAPPANQFVIVAEEGRRLAAFACAYGDDDARWGTLFDNLHVHGDWQERGLGRNLVVKVADWCVAEYPEIGLYLLVLEQNNRAREFLRAAGSDWRGRRNVGTAGFPQGAKPSIRLDTGGSGDDTKAGDATG